MGEIILEFELEFELKIDELDFELSGFRVGFQEAGSSLCFFSWTMPSWSLPVTLRITVVLPLSAFF